MKEVKGAKGTPETEESGLVLSMRDVSFSYAGKREGAGVQGISLEVRTGECVLLRGPSGCGKSTICRLANGLAPHFYEGTARGEVRVCGICPTTEPLYEAAHYTGSVFQNPRTQFFSTDVESEISFTCENLGFPEKDIRTRVDQATREFHLEELRGRSLFDLSGGQQQRVACASATTAHPSLVVLDEPSSNLDFDSIAHLHEAIARWKAHGCAVLVAEHRLHYLTELVDEVILLEAGCVARTWSGDAFRRLEGSELAQAGLRSNSLEHVFSDEAGKDADGNAVSSEAAAKAEAPSTHAGGSIALKDFRFA